MSDEEISIKINICDRYYPLRIKIQEEEAVRGAAKKINERARYYIENFSVQDKQDALAMVALEVASQDQNENKTDIDFENLANKLQSIEAILNK